MTKIGVLASGRGSNFQSIIDAVESGRLNVSIECLITNNPNAFAIERAKAHGITYMVILQKDFPTKDDYYKKIVSELQTLEVNLVVLAGFMKLVGKPLIDAYPMRIMNIHPALLPSFKGLHAQRQAIEYGVKISGSTVHFVDEGLDSGPIIIQAAVPVFSDDTEDTLSERILKSEHEIYPQAIKLFADGALSFEGRVVKFPVR
ncbi:phosphoribosylglycinamide formyltransferase [Candidatus Magnetomonas plexicatena]|uniref:phosphoribosylglycinamide formyltransferase n=1 Tax=Candidatus Magnetomonas plexicatena TaxID=2552947 RepID=UPI001C76B413|nr:phosphoribosylglycinamide formyltransferase [Nitrospirales bacterium LBB_01]